MTVQRRPTDVRRFGRGLSEAFGQRADSADSEALEGLEAAGWKGELRLGNGQRRGTYCDSP